MIEGVIHQKVDRQYVDSHGQSTVAFAFFAAGKTDQILNRGLGFKYDRSNLLTRKTDYQGDVTRYQFDASGALAFETNAACNHQYDDVADQIDDNGAAGGTQVTLNEPSQRISQCRRPRKHAPQLRIGAAPF